MIFPENLKYTKEHEWLRTDGTNSVIGITDFAQGELGDIVYIELPAVGTKVEQAKTFGTIEAVKAVSDLYAPVTGVIVEINSALNDQPELVNKDPYGKGWMVKLALADQSQLNQLLNAGAYKTLVGK